MANTYVINPPVQNGDQLIVTGTVNQVPVTVLTWVSAISSGVLASVVAWENFITPLMLQQYNTILQQGQSVVALGTTPLTVTK